MKKQKSGKVDVSTHLTLSDAGLCDVFKERMAKEVMNCHQQYTQTQRELEGNLYLVPSNYDSWKTEWSTPSTCDVLLYEALKIRRENGMLDTVVFRMAITKVGRAWKVDLVKQPEDLYGNFYPMDNFMFTVKRATTGEKEALRFIKNSRLDVMAYAGTSLYNGDKLDLRYRYEDGRSVAVSTDGSDKANFFPITIRVISPPSETHEEQTKYVQISPQFSRLARCNHALHTAFRDRMAVPEMKPLVASVQRSLCFKNELRGFCYLQPKPYRNVPEGGLQFELVGPKQFELVLMLPSVRLKQPDNSIIDRGLSFIWKQKYGEWQLQRNNKLSCPRMEITIKRAGADEWTRVNMSSVFFAWQRGSGRQVYWWQGTNFRDGDQMNVRYVHSGRSHPVSFDGTEDTNIFPVTIRVIG
jgi:hypothetical protein